MSIKFTPSLEEIQEYVLVQDGNTIPVYATIPADLLTPVSAYLRIAAKSDYSFLLESISGGEKLGRYSFLGADPYKILKTEDNEGDPLIGLENELKSTKYIRLPEIPSFTGGAIGYIGYDCVKYFEPRTARDLKDPLGLPDSYFLFCDTMVIFDHTYQTLYVVSHYRNDSKNKKVIEIHYKQALEKIKRLLLKLQSDYPTSSSLEVPQGEIILNQQTESNVGKSGYEAFVTKLKQHIVKGDIIQAVPSQRLARPTTLHPFNVYRYLRTINPSPYMFYINLKDFQIVGASPELLIKVENDIVYTHPIAGTRKRGKTPKEDDELANELLNDPKERAEHIMLLDLGRNDINRVCESKSVKVDSFMQIEKYSHVMHIVSHVSGKLRPDKSRFDAFRSIFPAGTVSGAPKVRAIELISELEQEKRGIYAGAVGHFDFSNSIDTCIAIRTMVFKNGVAYLQAGGGIVYDSVEEDEYKETVNKLKSNVTCIDQAEQYHYRLHQS